MLEQGLEVPSIEGRREWFEAYLGDLSASVEIRSNEAPRSPCSLWIEIEFEKRSSNWLMPSESICLLGDYDGGMDPLSIMTSGRIPVRISNSSARSPVRDLVASTLSLC